MEKGIKNTEQKVFYSFLRAERKKSSCPLFFSKSLYFGKIYGKSSVIRETILKILDFSWQNPEIETQIKGVEMSLSRVDQSTYKLVCSITPEDVNEILNTTIKINNQNGDEVAIPLIAVRTENNQ
jgi:hypothetical protein